jgi:hypothetical protein
MSSPTPFFCDMTALTGEQRARHHELAALLQASLSGIRELLDGYGFEFSWSLDIYATLAEAVESLSNPRFFKAERASRLF